MRYRRGRIRGGARYALRHSPGRQMLRWVKPVACLNRRVSKEITGWPWMVRRKGRVPERSKLVRSAWMYFTGVLSLYPTST